MPAPPLSLDRLAGVEPRLDFEKLRPGDGGFDPARVAVAGDGQLAAADGRLLLKVYEQGLDGYTYQE